MIAQLVLPLWFLLYLFYLYASVPSAFLLAAIVYGYTFSSRADRPALSRLSAGVLVVSLVNAGLLASSVREMWDDVDFTALLITAVLLATPVLAALAWRRARTKDYSGFENG